MKKMLILLLVLSNQILAKETRKKIALIDTGISLSRSNSKYLCQDGIVHYGKVFSMADSHADQLFDIMIKNLDNTKHCITSFAVFNSDYSSTIVEHYVFALAHAKIKNYDVVNLSLQGDGGGKIEEIIIKDILNNKSKVFVAAGNYGRNLNFNCNTYPACHRKLQKFNCFFVVGSNAEYSNFGKIVDFIGKKDYDGLRGTSYATAHFSSLSIELQDCAKH